MNHQNGRRKLNCSSKHRKALLRNQALLFIKYGVLRTTTARIKEVRKLVEKVVTIARNGNDFNARRKVMSILPYESRTVEKLFKEIAPKYVNRPGGYTRIRLMQQRLSDTAQIAQLTWVEEEMTNTTASTQA
jgi:large subunit ribosomal protein L17